MKFGTLSFCKIKTHTTLTHTTHSDQLRSLTSLLPSSPSKLSSLYVWMRCKGKKCAVEVQTLTNSCQLFPPLVAKGNIPCHYHLWQYFSKCALVVIIVLEITFYWDNLERERLTSPVFYTLLLLRLTSQPISHPPE